MEQAELRSKRVAELITSQSKLVAFFLSVSAEPNTRPAPTEWSYAEVAAHMLQVEIECFWHRIQRITTEDEPEFSYYLNTGWNFGPISITDAVSEWIVWRKRVIALIESLNDEQLAREGVHSYFGRITPLDVLKIAVDHDAEHFLDLQKTSGM